MKAETINVNRGATLDQDNAAQKNWKNFVIKDMAANSVHTA
jgi:hypothetical protein